MKKLLRIAAALALLVGAGVAEAQVAPGNISLYAALLTPTATTASIQTVEQTFTVNGVAVGDRVTLSGPAPTSLCPPVAARVSAANTIAIAFTVLTAAACTPASGTYYFTGIR